jgi:transposase-like protein
MVIELNRQQDDGEARVKARFSRAQILEFLRGIDEGRERSIASACARIGISRQTYYDWRAQYGVASGHHQLIEQLETNLQLLSERLAVQQAVLQSLRAQLGPATPVRARPAKVAR